MLCAVALLSSTGNWPSVARAQTQSDDAAQPAPAIAGRQATDAATDHEQISFMGRAHVIDGDTIHVWDKGRYGGKKWKVRIYGVDAPEMDTRAGVVAKKQMAAVLSKGNFWVACRVRTRDVYERVVAVCYPGQRLLAAEEASINIAMLRSGYGFAYRHFLTPDSYREYLAAEKAAHDAGLGFWADKNFVRKYRAKKHF